MVGRIHFLIPGSCENVRLNGKKELRLQMELRFLTNWPQNRLSWITERAQSKSIRRRQKRICQEDVTTEERHERLQCSHIRWWKWAMIQAMWVSFRRSKGHGSTFSLELEKGTQSCWNLDFIPVRCMSDS